MKDIALSTLIDNLRSKVLLAYLLLLAALCFSSLMLETNDSKAALTIMSLMLLTVPLVALLYTAIYLYNSREYIVMLLTQPLQRRVLWCGLYAGVSGALVLAFVLGVGVPALIYLPISTALRLVVTGIAVTLVFTSLAFLVVSIADDKARGIGICLIIWLVSAMIWDALLLYVLMAFGEWPIEKGIMALLMLNPLDLARFQVIIGLDALAMMGYSGAMFANFLGKTLGIIVSAAVMLLWIVLPFVWSCRRFARKDL